MIRYFFIITTLLGLTLSCSSDNDNISKEDTPTTANQSEYSDPNLKIKEITKNIQGDVMYTQVKNLFTNLEKRNKEGEFVKFNLEQGELTKGDDWDIAIWRRIIIVNGGSWPGAGTYAQKQPKRTGNAAIYIAKESEIEFEKLAKVPNEATFLQDTNKDGFAIDDNGQGMFMPYGTIDENDDDTTKGHKIIINKNKYLIIKTHNGHYAKLRILDIYKNGKSTAAGSMEEVWKYYPYYKFEYYLNTKQGNKTLK